MKKKLPAALLAAAMILCLLPTSALAATGDYTLYYNSADSKMYSDETYLTEVTTLSNWSGSGVTLTLTNFNFSTTAATALYLPAGCTLTLEGVNTVTSTYAGAGNTYGLYIPGGITVNGTGGLTATGGSSSAGNSYGVFTDNSIETSGSCSFTAAAGSAPAGISYGIYASNSIETSANSSLVGIAGTSSEGGSYGVYTVNNIEVSGGSLTGTGNTAKTSYGVCATKDITVSAGKLKGTSGNAGSGLIGIGVASLEGNFIVSGGSLEGIGGASQQHSYGVSVSSALSVTISITGGSTIAKAEVNGTPSATRQAFSEQPALSEPSWYKWRKTENGAYTLGSATEYVQSTGDAYSNIVHVSALTFTNNSFDVPEGAVNTDIETINVTGGVMGGAAPYTYEKISGPDWLSVSDAGIISGTRPSSEQTATTAVVGVSDNVAASANITINVGAVTGGSEPSPGPEPTPEPASAPVSVTRSNPHTGVDISDLK